jgi:hypothetical protein
MSRLVLALWLGFGLGGPPLTGVVTAFFEAVLSPASTEGGSTTTSPQGYPDSAANADAGGLWDPNG